MQTEKTLVAYRHGELLFVEIDKIPDGLKEAIGNIIITGSNNNPHTFKGGKLYLKDDNYIIGYLVAKNTTLFHLEHGNGTGKLKEAKLSDNNYKILRQWEFINKEMIPIID